MRQQDATVNTALFDYLQQRNSQFVCGIDFAGPEAPFPPNTIFTLIPVEATAVSTPASTASNISGNPSPFSICNIGAKRISIYFTLSRSAWFTTSTTARLGLPEIFEAVEAGVETAVASTGIKVNLLVCAMRQQDATVNTALFDYLQQRNSQLAN